MCGQSIPELAEKAQALFNRCRTPTGQCRLRGPDSLIDIARIARRSLADNLSIRRIHDWNSA
jgi:hypothetical protein